MTHSEALKLALDALGKWSIGYHVDAVQLNDLIATLEAAMEQPEQEPGGACARCGGWVCDPVLKLEQPEQEPVAWRTFDGEGGYDYRTYDGNENYRDEWDNRNPNHKGWVEPLYAHPSAIAKSDGQA